MMKKFTLCLCVIYGLLQANIIFAKKPKIPKQKIIDNFHLIAKKNEKKSKKNTNVLLSFRSSDFEGQYYIGGKTQAYFDNIVQDMLRKLDEDRPGLISDDLKQNLGLYVIHSQSLNAHSTRNNNILLTTQWIIDTQSVGEVATVIAHELAHLILKHPDTNVDRKLQTSALKKFSNIASTVTFLSGLRFNTTDKKLNMRSTKSSNKEVAKALLIGKLMVSAKRDLINPKISQKNEGEADFFSMDLISLTGYPIEAADQMFSVLLAYEEKNKEIVKLSNVYIKKIQPVFQNWVNKEVAKTGQNDLVKGILTAFIMKISSGVSLKIGTWLNDKKRKHLRADVRKVNIEAYRKEFYREDAPPSTPDEEFPDIQKLVKKIDEIFEDVAKNNILIDEGKFREAETNLRNINKYIDKSHPVRQMLWMVIAKLRIAQGRHNDAIENICKFSWGVDVKNCHRTDFDQLTSNNNFFIHLDEFTFLSEAFIHNNQFDKANSIINKGSMYYSDDTPFQVHEIIMACQENDYAKFKQGLAKCNSNEVIEIGQHCQTIEKQLELLEINEKNKQKEQEQNLGKFFTSIEQEELAWQTTCKIIKDNKPFSSITKNSKAINNKVIGMLENYKQK